MKDKNRDALSRFIGVHVGSFTEGAFRGAGVAVGIFWVAKKFGVLDSLKNLKK